MNEPLRLRIHVSEPFDFERQAGTSDLFGSTTDHAGADAPDEWLIELDEWFSFNELDYDQVLIGPRYVGEHLGRVFDALLGVPVRIAHRTPEGWHYAMTGMMSLAPLAPDEAAPFEAGEDEAPSGGATGEEDGDGDGD